VISISKLLCDPDAEGDGLRYDAAAGPSKLQIAEGRQRRPVVVWNLTRRCNLYCSHCYAGADTGAAPGELTTAEGGRLFEDLADYGVPVVLFSGGEPLVRDDLLELVGDAADLGLRPVLSTNGTLLTPERAAELRETGLAYAGVSVDGRPERNDAFRGQEDVQLPGTDQREQHRHGRPRKRHADLLPVRSGERAGRPGDGRLDDADVLGEEEQRRLEAAEDGPHDDPREDEPHG